MKWSCSWMKMTREYTGGILGGTGIGLMITGLILQNGWTDLPWILFFFLGSGSIVVGTTLARTGQRAREKKE